MSEIAGGVIWPLDEVTQSPRAKSRGKAVGIGEKSLRRHCELRRWALHAVHARANPIHVVVTAAGDRFWTKGGRCDWINDEAGLRSAVTSVLEVPARKGRDEAP